MSGRQSKVTVLLLASTAMTLNGQNPYPLESCGAVDTEDTYCDSGFIGNSAGGEACLGPGVRLNTRSISFAHSLSWHLTGATLTSSQATVKAFGNFKENWDPFPSCWPSGETRSQVDHPLNGTIIGANSLSSGYFVSGSWGVYPTLSTPHNLPVGSLFGNYNGGGSGSFSVYATNTSRSIANAPSGGYTVFRERGQVELYSCEFVSMDIELDPDQAISPAIVIDGFNLQGRAENLEYYKTIQRITGEGHCLSCDPLPVSYEDAFQISMRIWIRYTFGGYNTSSFDIFAYADENGFLVQGAAVPRSPDNPNAPAIEDKCVNINREVLCTLPLGQHAGHQSVSEFTAVDNFVNVLYVTPSGQYLGNRVINLGRSADVKAMPEKISVRREVFISYNESVGSQCGSSCSFDAIGIVRDMIANGPVYRLSPGGSDYHPMYDRDFDGDIDQDDLDLLTSSSSTCCVGDTNGDGSVTGDDIFAFTDLWYAEDPRADFNGDGAVTADDIFAYLDVYFAQQGPCGG